MTIGQRIDRCRSCKRYVKNCVCDDDVDSHDIEWASEVGKYPYD